ncbi:triphosphoribosyl-dephospho-CoA synthase [Enterobacter hormaechei]
MYRVRVKRLSRRFRTSCSARCRSFASAVSTAAAKNAGQTDALMAIMTSLTDTCVLSRAGMEGLDAMQNGARAVLNAGGARNARRAAGAGAVRPSDAALNASPGGAADLLAATLFLDRVETPYSKH